MVKDTSNEIKFVKNAIGNWVSDHTEIEAMSADTLEVATTEIDAYGDTVYCFIQKIDDTYKIGDDGHILFKLDPGVTDTDLYQTAEEIALGAGFEFDQSSAEISVQTAKVDIAQAVEKLAQLQVAISYLE